MTAPQRLRAALAFTAALTFASGCQQAAESGGALASMPPVVGHEAAAPAYEQAPDFTLPGVDGPFALAEQQGHVVVLTFWATWSEPSVAYLDTVAALAFEMSDDLVAVGIAQDDGGLDALEQWADAGVTGTLPAVTLVADADHAVAHQYGDVEMLPTTVVIDREGRLRARHVGALSGDALLELMAPVLIEAEEAPVAALPASDGSAVIETLAPRAVAELVADGAALLDVRSAATVSAEGTLRYAEQRPLDTLAPTDLPANFAVPVIFLADTDEAAHAAAERAAEWGYTTVYAVGGGVAAWRAAGLPVVTAQPTPLPHTRGAIG